MTAGPPALRAMVDRLTLGGNIIETGTVSYRLAHTRQQQPAEQRSRDRAGGHHQHETTGSRPASTNGSHWIGGGFPVIVVVQWHLSSKDHVATEWMSAAPSAADESDPSGLDASRAWSEPTSTPGMPMSAGRIS